MAIQIVVFLFAISVHESAHAWTASRYGDPTARMLGRVSLNPIRHIDPIGTVLMPLIAYISHIPMIGWAKPTPVNPLNFRKNYVMADIMTSLAGPVSNLLVATASVVVLAIVIHARFLLGGAAEPLWLLFRAALEINVLLAVFNLIPIPPLDGSHVIRHMLSESARNLYDRIGWIGLILFFLVGGSVLRVMMTPFLNFFNFLLAVLI
ncbi:MAG TPA: site-2 protease family protein [Candidatus Margulisiibacteriota bacterium]|nr:site-2 protease family protein [Candidatus Margulisiibacteriota bacterium]